MPDPIEVPARYDFASTLCYVAHRVMGDLEEELGELGVMLVWQPLDLTRLTGWRRGASLTGPLRDNALRVARELGVTVRMPTRWIDSREANAGALALAGTPSEPAWRERVFSAIHEEGRCPDEPGVLDALLRDLSLERGALCGPEALARLEKETELAREGQVTGVPAFVLDGWPLTGIQHTATMRSLFTRWVAKKRAGEAAS